MQHCYLNRVNNFPGPCTCGFSVAQPGESCYRAKSIYTVTRQVKNDEMAESGDAFCLSAENVATKMQVSDFCIDGKRRDGCGNSQKLVSNCQCSPTSKCTKNEKCIDAACHSYCQADEMGAVLAHSCVCGNTLCEKSEVCTDGASGSSAGVICLDTFVVESSMRFCEAGREVCYGQATQCNNQGCQCALEENALSFGRCSAGSVECGVGEYFDGDDQCIKIKSLDVGDAFTITECGGEPFYETSARRCVGDQALPVCTTFVQTDQACACKINEEYVRIEAGAVCGLTDFGCPPHYKVLNNECIQVSGANAISGIVHIMVLCIASYALIVLLVFVDRRANLGKGCSQEKIYD